MTPSQYRIENAIHRIDGYLVPRPNESPSEAFARAKAEALANLRRDLADVEAITEEQFNYRRR